MRTLTIFRFEFAYQARRLSTWIYLGVLLAFTFVMNAVTTPGDGVNANNTFHITAVTVIGALIWLIMAAPVAGEAAARDVKIRMNPLIGTVPVSRPEYLGGRFLAALAVNALLIAALPAGVLLSFYVPGSDQGPVGPFLLAPYLNVYFLIALPCVFIGTALQFSLSALSRQVTAGYAASLLLALVAQVIAVAAAKLFGNWDLVKLLDPVGVAGIVGSELSTWTPAEKNTRLVALEGMFLWNRLLWPVIAALVLGATFYRFDFRNAEPGKGLFRRSAPKGELPAETPAIRPAGISAPRVQGAFGFGACLRQALTIGSASYRKIAGSPVGLMLVAAVAGFSAVFGSRIITELGIPLIPTTRSVLNYLTANVGDLTSPWVIMPLLIVYFTGELVWRERDSGLSDLTDATPVSEWVLLAGKFLGMALIIITWMAILMACGMLMQLGLGYDHLEPDLYLKTLFGLQFVDYLLFALLALVIHVIVNQKYIGYLVALLAMAFIAFPLSFGIEHTMLIFGADPGWRYTDMRGFGSTVGPWLWFKAYWIGWALMQAVAARLLWPRGREQRLRSRMRSVRSRFTGATVRVAAVACALIIAAGGAIFYHTNVLNEYVTSAGMNERKAAYERLYGRYRNIPQPQLTGTRLWADIYPERQEVRIRATYTLVNTGSIPIDSIHLGSVSGLEPADVRFSRPAAPVLRDKELSHYIYGLGQPLQPGDSLQLDFAVHFRQRGFVHKGTNTMVVKGGTYITNYDMLPGIGYQSSMELSDAVLRKKHGLAARPAWPSLDDPEARRRPFSTDRNSFEATISTAGDEVAVAPGNLERTWTEGDRRFFRYRTSKPIRGEYALLSGNYQLKESSWNGIAIRIFHYPGHAQSSERTLKSIRASLEHYTGSFGPYPFDHFTVVERPGVDGGLSSEAGMVDFGEPYALMNPDDGPDGFDLPFYIMAHEVAHQWWGGAGLTPAYVEGAGVLVEGLAVYSGMQVLEKIYGEGHTRQYVNYLHSFYEMPRSAATASLLRADEPFLYYRKAGLALYTLSRYIGREPVNAALRNLLDKHRSGVLPLPTTPDLYREIARVTPDSLTYLLNDLFKTNTYWRLRTKSVAAERNRAGNWEVTLQVQAQKVIIDHTGQEREVPMNDLLEVGLYEEDKSLGEPLYLRMHRIRPGAQTIRVTVPRKPDRGGIDPNFLMIDIRTDDNIVEAKGG